MMTNGAAPASAVELKLADNRWRHGIYRYGFAPAALAAGPLAVLATSVTAASPF
ncbi:hypothetical protein [Mycobacterium stomatepiae]|uniref:Uncharacterized protein n=1 Tax=Mycobacterium stomatepiae TaxID=470076 RepID=A0A7I7Q7E4_9MYCO|nr:hypothetical protein [Mycobacterium stomatepiae]MCV7163185.1 hypothetical protein [Mycobacterium stomatepiae]BBY22051.1 hypothetical protein MSTO_22560 [Mycobacterium stomatepiae]